VAQAPALQALPFNHLPPSSVELVDTAAAAPGEAFPRKQIKSSNMRIKNGFVLRTILGENVVTGEGLEQVNFSKLITLNDTAAFLWKELEGKEFDVDAMTALLTDNYEVEEAVARADSEKLCNQWKEMGLIEG
jgi:hypothetical protein